MSLLEKHKKTIQKLNCIVKEINNIKNGIAVFGENNDILLPKRIENLEKTLVKIDDYELKIQAYIKMAEEHIECKNLSTIEAPEGYRVSLSRLRKWSLMIDPLSTNDPYANRIYLVANCDLMFLAKKKKEFTERIEFLKNANENRELEATEEMQLALKKLEQELDALLNDAEFIDFANDVVRENTENARNTDKEVFNASNKASFPLGARMLPMSYCNEEHKQKLMKIFGWTYNSNSSRIAIPFDDIENNKEFGITVSCVPAKTRINELDSGVRNFLFNIIDGSSPGTRKISIIDAERQNSILAGGLKKLEGTFALDTIPRNEEQVSNALESIVSSFSDIDDTIEAFDSVVEYNAIIEEKKQIERRVVVLVGWPNAFSSDDQRLVNRIISNYERYGISFILINFSQAKKNSYVDSNPFNLSDYILENLIQIDMNGKDIDAKFHEEEFKFAWYSFKNELSSQYIASYSTIKIEDKKISNLYPELYDVKSVPNYTTREYKEMVLPFGLDGKGKPNTINFENENFAAFLEGASRSGKSTLLHTLISGIIMNYHPDNVELWLADFKQLEFKNYITNRPPHVKYVLLDESAELVYDLIDKLNDEMMRRQQLLSVVGQKKLSQVKLEAIKTKLGHPLPVLFVILDEFSIMSQQIAGNDSYKLKLQNLLAKGAALGMMFIFSSQTFTTGVTGLSATARAQIQQRIAMKGSLQEISETLELSSAQKTEQVRNWISALPPRYALVKSRKDMDTPPTVNRYYVLYFDEKERNNMIASISNSMKPVEEFNPDDMSTYVDKHPVFVDGRTYKAFVGKEFIAKVKAYVKETGKKPDSDTIVTSFGTPRLMVDTRFNYITSESRENILLIAKSQESIFASSIITTTMRCCIAFSTDVEVWAYERNTILNSNKDVEWKDPKYRNVRIFTSLDEICDNIRATKKAIKDGINKKKMIILLGFERICSEFEFADDSISNMSSVNAAESYREAMKAEAAKRKELEKTGAITVDPVKKLKNDLDICFYYNFYTELLKQYSKAEIAEKFPMDYLIENPEEFFEKAKLKKPENYENCIKLINDINNAINNPESEVQVEEETAAKTEDKPETKGGFYNALEDFKFIVRQGSRFGFHFMVVLNDYSDLKQLTSLKVDWFRHRLAFQVNKDDSLDLFKSRVAANLPEHVCQYSDTINTYSFRPYIHKEINWDGWYVDDNNQARNHFKED